MSWSNSFIPSATIRDTLKGVVTPKIGAASTPDTLKLALYDTSFAQTISDDPFTYSTTHEVTGTNWSAGGVSLSGVTVAQTATTSIGVMLDASDVSVASTTLSGVLGAVVYDSTLSPKAGVAAVYFGGTSYSTTNGTFAIQWDSLGIWYITLH